jgi:hypothetical protein
VDNDGLTLLGVVDAVAGDEHFDLDLPWPLWSLLLDSECPAMTTGMIHPHRIQHREVLGLHHRDWFLVKELRGGRMRRRQRI